MTSVARLEGRLASKNSGQVGPPPPPTPFPRRHPQHHTVRNPGRGEPSVQIAAAELPEHLVGVLGWARSFKREQSIFKFGESLATLTTIPRE